MTQTLEYMIDVMTRAKAGEQVQRKIKDLFHDWHYFDYEEQGINTNSYEYRKKPREPRVVWMNEIPNGELMHGTTYTEKPDNTWKQIKLVEVLDDE